MPDDERPGGGYEAALRVGGRVKIGPKACSYTWCGWWEDDDDTIIAEGEAGVIGWVPDPDRVLGPSPSIDGHDYGVKLNGGIAWFLPQELIPLDAPS